MNVFILLLGWNGDNVSPNMPLSLNLFQNPCNARAACSGHADRHTEERCRSCGGQCRDLSMKTMVAGTSDSIDNRVTVLLQVSAIPVEIGITLYVRFVMQ